MPRLMLIRHAKAGPHTGPWEDRERPLADSGRQDALVLGQRLAAAGLRPDLVLCSPALRTRQTFERLDRAFQPPIRSLEEPRIYDAAAETLLRLIGEVPQDVGFLCLVGHNPGLGDLAARLLDAAGRAVWMAAGGAMQTGCAVVMDAGSTGWSGIEAGGLRLVRIFKPDDGVV